MTLKGYLPPEGPQNVHGVPHNYIDGQGTHRVGETVVYSPEAVILTADPDAQDEIETAGLQEVPQEVAEEALDAYQDEDGDAGQVIEEWQQSDEDAQEEEPDAEPAEAEDEEQPDSPEDIEDGTDGPAIPSDLTELDYRGEDTVTLQHLAQSYGIPANQSAEELREALREIRDS
jgi:hypothetical protein